MSDAHNVLVEPAQQSHGDSHVHSAELPLENLRQLAARDASSEEPKSAAQPAPPRAPGDYESVEPATVLWA